MISCLKKDKDFITKDVLSYRGCAIGETKEKSIKLFNPGHVVVRFYISIED